MADLPPLTERLRRDPPFVHAADDYYGLAWDALAWLESSVDSSLTTLETGAGASTIVFAAAGSTHAAISPDPEEHARIARWCEEEGIDASGVTFRAESSTEALTGAWSFGELDVALIDGAHSFPYPAIDWFFAAAHLKVGGRLLIDDAHLPPVNSLVSYLRANPSWELESVLGYRTPLFRKVDDAEPPVEPDWTGGRLDGRPRFDYLPPGRRAVTWARNRLIDRGPLLGLARRIAARRSR